jgi:putative sterol carrier protein
MKNKYTPACLTTLIAVAIFESAGFTNAASSEKPNSTPQDVFDGMKQSFRADKAKGVHARYQWQLSGPAGGEWWIDVNDGTFKMGRGKIDNPSVTFITSDKDWVAMSNGKLKGTWAFVTGRLKVRGSQSIARKLDEIFP